MSGVTKVGPMPVPTVEDVEYALEIWRLSAEYRQVTDAYQTTLQRLKPGQSQAEWKALFHRMMELQAIVFTQKASSASAVLEAWWAQIQARQAQSPEKMVAAIYDCMDAAEYEPIRLSVDTWVFKGIRYTSEGPYTHEQFKLLILDEFDSERRRFEHLKHKFYGTTEGAERGRPRVPENVRIEIWRRDGGQCARCGSRDHLEYDHIVPVSKGGSNTARNIELLCENCNRSKGAQIG